MSRKILLVMAVLLLFAGLATTAWAADNRNFVAVLSGEGAGRETQARGVAIFQLNQEGDAISYKLIAANIDNVFQAHIHLTPAPGPIVAWLYPSAPPAVSIPGAFNGVLHEGVITAANLVGPLAGASLEGLLALMRNDGTYVNVHTNDFVDPPNTGPGDFPGGEISATIMAH